MWDGVPFFRRTGSIDVSLARFRGAGDSADVFIGARVPLRDFKMKGEADAKAEDRITLGVWLTNNVGAPIFHADTARPLPTGNVTAWTQQWRYRAGSLNMMHRVEAIETSRPFGSRGVAQFTSDALVAFPLHGFGMSDVLIVDRVNKPDARRWSDLPLQTNGNALAPMQPFTMVWEVYDLQPGRDGRVRWRVRIRRERGTMTAQTDMSRVLTGESSAGTRVRAAESDAPDLSYERSEAASKVLLNQLNFSLGDAGVGRHVVNVTVDDLVSGKSVTRGVSVRIFLPASERR